MLRKPTSRLEPTCVTCSYVLGELLQFSYTRIYINMIDVTVFSREFGLQNYDKT